MTRRRIPNTGALVAFDAAARHENFSRAAVELSLTHSAVCRKVAGLEEFLGVRLFRRTRHGARLTEAGLAYAREVAQRLEEMERDVMRVAGRQGRGGDVNLAVVPTFATRWLLPRLNRFYGGWPDADVNLSVRTRPFLFSETEFDAAIYCGDGNWPGTRARFLMDEAVAPVCGTGLLRCRSRPSAEDLGKMPLLQQSTRPYAWRQWFEAAGADVQADLAGPRFELFSMLAEAAMQNMGVALIPPMLIEGELQARSLVQLAPARSIGARAYYFVVPERRRETEILDAFGGWLVEEARRESRETTRAAMQ